MSKPHPTKATNEYRTTNSIRRRMLLLSALLTSLWFASGGNQTVRAQATHYCNDAANICYEIPPSWDVAKFQNGKFFSSPDKTMGILLTTPRTQEAPTSLVAMMAFVALLVDGAEVRRDLEEYTLQGMRALRFSGDGYYKGSRVKWGFDVIVADKPLIILSLVDANNYRASAPAYTSIFRSLRRKRVS